MRNIKEEVKIEVCNLLDDIIEQEIADMIDFYPITSIAREVIHRTRDTKIKGID